MNYYNINSITEKIIESMVEEIIVYPNRKLDITINGKKFPDVAATRLCQTTSTLRHLKYWICDEDDFCKTRRRIEEFGTYSLASVR